MLAIKQNLSIETEEIENSKKQKNEKSNAKFISKIKLLSAQLSLLTLFKKPKKLYKEKELYKVYLDFLTYKNSGIQLLALKCILNYNFNFVTSYKEHLEKLMNDAEFRNELLNISSKISSKDFKMGDRKKLMEIIIR